MDIHIYLHNLLFVCIHAYIFVITYTHKLLPGLGLIFTLERVFIVWLWLGSFLLFFILHISSCPSPEKNHCMLKQDIR